MEVDVNEPIKTLLFFLAVALTAPLMAADAVSDREALKAELLQELLADPRLRQLIREEIKAHYQREVEQRKEKWRQRKQEQQARVRKYLPPVRPGQEWVYGNPNAAVTVVEYSDFDCPFCRRLHPTLKRLVDDSNGRINWVYRHFLDTRRGGEGALLKAQAAECAGRLGDNEAFWRFTERLFLQPIPRGRRSPQVDDAKQALAAIAKAAKEAGVDDDRLLSCVNQGTYRQAVLEDVEGGKRMGLKGTPASILIHNPTGKTNYRPGALSLRRLQQQIESLTGQAPQGRP